jgi:hypothetical protein
MTQPPFQSDGLQIEPGSGQTLKIVRKSGPDGAMRFYDALIPGGVDLEDMAGLSAIDGVFIVGRSGAGAKYLTIQSAIDEVPSNASATNPYAILVFPGVYGENIVINKDGIAIVAIGQARLVGVTNLPTVKIVSGVLTTPLTTLIRGMRIETSFAGKECVLVQGGPGLSVGTGGILLKDCDLAAKGVGSYTCRADTANVVQLQDCRSDDSSPSAILYINQCASFRASGGSHPASQTDYDSGGPTPVTPGSAYSFENCRSVGPILSTLQNIGSLKIQDCLATGALTFNGNRSALIQTSAVGNIVTGGSAAVKLVASTRGTLSGTGTVDEQTVSGTVSFVASSSQPVVFPVPRSNANYGVYLDTGLLANVRITGKTAAGFTIDFGVVQTTTVTWTVVAL